MECACYFASLNGIAVQPGLHVLKPTSSKPKIVAELTHRSNGATRFYFTNGFTASATTFMDSSISFTASLVSGASAMMRMMGSVLLART